MGATGAEKRTAQSTHEVPGQPEMFAGDRRDAARAYTPQVRFATIVREFGHILGSATHIRSLVTQLKKLGFVGGRGDILEAGPLLELGIDGERMVAFIRREVLARLLAEKAQVAEDEDPGASLLAVLVRLGGSAAISELERETGQKRGPLLRLLRVLQQEGRIRRVGQRGTGRWERVA